MGVGYILPPHLDPLPEGEGTILLPLLPGEGGGEVMRYSANL